MRLRGVIRCTGHSCSAWFDRLRLSEKVTKPFMDAARWFPLSIHPFVPISHIIYAGIAVDDDDRYTHVIVMHYTLLSFI